MAAADCVLRVASGCVLSSVAHHCVPRVPLASARVPSASAGLAVGETCMPAHAWESPLCSARGHVSAAARACCHHALP
eukprot:6162502-Pleurochrysis_carterae.AAC.1